MYSLNFKNSLVAIKAIKEVITKKGSINAFFSIFNSENSFSVNGNENLVILDTLYGEYQGNINNLLSFLETATEKFMNDNYIL